MNAISIQKFPCSCGRIITGRYRQAAPLENSLISISKKSMSLLKSLNAPWRVALKIAGKSTLIFQKFAQNSFMTYNDFIGTIGVGLVLFAYFLNTMKYIPVNGKLFYVMNIIGAAFAAYASYLIIYWPFIILEGTWTLVSIYGLMRTMRIKLT